MMAVASGAPPRDVRWRRQALLVYGSLLFAAVALDISLYVGGVFRLYTHDLASLAVGVLGILLAREDRSALPKGRLFWIPLALLGFLVANTVVIGALQYSNVSTDMRKLFWFEHGNALRIVGELLVWLWTLGHLSPTREDATVVLDFGLWGAALSVGVVGTYWVVTGTTHLGTTTFDLDVMVGAPMAMMFVMTRGRRYDLVRLVIFAAATLLLYSRTSIVAVAFTCVALLIVSRRPRAVRQALACIVAGWIVTVVASMVLSEIGATVTQPSPSSSTPPPLSSNSSGPPSSSASAPTIGYPALDHTVSLPKDDMAGLQPAVERTASLVDNQLASYTIPSRLVIWRDAVRIFEISPVVGVGYHNYFLYSGITEVKDASRFDVPGLFSSLIKQAHNDFLSWLAETGVVGLALYLAFWSLTLRSAWQLWRAEPDARERNTFTLAFLLSLLGVSALGEILVPRTPDWTSSAILWWITIGLLFIDAGRRRESERRAIH